MTGTKLAPNIADLAVWSETTGHVQEGLILPNINKKVFV